MVRSLQLDKEKAVLIIIDVQEGLMKAMDRDVGKNLIRNLEILIAFARDMEIPMLVTEQYPKGLGRTIPEIGQALGPILPVEKVSFSCSKVAPFDESLRQSGRKQVVLVGMETHVCVLQTAADLIERGYEVHVVADAVCSRRKLDWETALRWMEKNGAMISTTEIIAFQLLKEAGTDEFKRLSRMVK